MFLYLLALASCALALPAPMPYYYGKETYGRGRGSGSTTTGLAIGIFFACAGGAVLFFTIATLVVTRCMKKKEQAEAAGTQTTSEVRSSALYLVFTLLTLKQAPVLSKDAGREGQDSDRQREYVQQPSYEPSINATLNGSRPSSLKEKDDSPA